MGSAAPRVSKYTSSYVAFALSLCCCCSRRFLKNGIRSDAMEPCEHYELLPVWRPFVGVFLWTHQKVFPARTYLSRSALAVADTTMCKGGPELKFDRASRIERWGVATNEEIRAAIQAPDLVWLDVRTSNETAEKPLPSSLKIKHCTVTMFTTKALAEQAPTLLPTKTAPLMIFCSGGGRADEARKCLRGLGYTGAITNAACRRTCKRRFQTFCKPPQRKTVKRRMHSLLETSEYAGFVLRVWRVSANVNQIPVVTGLVQY